MPHITSITAIPVAIPLRTPMKLASEMITSAENLVVQVVDSDGVEGWGEAASAPTMTGELLPGMVAAVERSIAPALIGRPSDDLRPANKALHGSIYANPGAKAAVDIALHDLVGKRKTRPVHTLLGAAVHRAFPAIRMIGPGKPESFVRDIEQALAAGFSHYKLKVGAKVRDDVDNANLLRRTIGPQCHLSADANMGWGVTDAIEFLDCVNELDVTYLEQPVAEDDLEGMTSISQKSAVPLCIDEALHSPLSIVRHADAGAARGAGIKLIKLAGYSGAAEAERLCRAYGWNSTYASKIAETSVGAAAVLHAAALAETVDWGVSITNQYLADDLVQQSIQINKGVVKLPRADGLGVSIDTQKLNHYRLDG